MLTMSTDHLDVDTTLLVINFVLDRDFASLDSGIFLFCVTQATSEDREECLRSSQYGGVWQRW